MCLPAALCEHFPPSCSFKGVLKFNHIVLHHSSLEIFEPNGCFLGECLNQNFLRKCIFFGGYGAVTHPLCSPHSSHPSCFQDWLGQHQAEHEWDSPCKYMKKSMMIWVAPRSRGNNLPSLHSSIHCPPHHFFRN